MEQELKSPIQKLKSNSGQAVVEYTLLLVIIVALCVGIGKGFGTLNKFLNTYIGDYTACLMEYGELPSLGTKVTELDRHTSGIGKKCNQQYEPFSFADGRPSSGGSGTSSGGNGQNGNKSNSANGGADGRNGTDSNKNAANASKTGNGGDDSEGSQGSGGLDKFGNGGTSKSPYKNGQIARSGSPFGTIEGNDDSQRVKIIEVDEDENSGRKRKNNKNLSAVRSDYDRSGYHAITGKMQEEYQKTLKNKTSRAPTSSVTFLPTGDGGFLPYKSQLTPRTLEKTKISDDDNSKLSFGGFLRFLIIAGMVVAIVVFFGGQIMNYSNSQD